MLFRSYIADWYNPIIQHGEVDFRDPRRDHVHGRIWRVTAKGRPLVKKPEFLDAPTEVVLSYLKDPEQWTRQQAKRVLKERADAEILFNRNGQNTGDAASKNGTRKRFTPVLTALKEWSSQLLPRESDYEHNRLESYWVELALGIGGPEGEIQTIDVRQQHEAIHSEGRERWQ